MPGQRIQFMYSRYHRPKKKKKRGNNFIEPKSVKRFNGVWIAREPNDLMRPISKVWKTNITFYARHLCIFLFCVCFFFPSNSQTFHQQKSLWKLWKKKKKTALSDVRPRIIYSSIIPVIFIVRDINFFFLQPQNSCSSSIAKHNLSFLIIRIVKRSILYCSERLGESK